ncbi:MAG: hypothetical protein NTX91_02655 [candidate division SR1 bacterium]|nr:hypothetical protein [candidate division SR1 bacterium]
MFLIFALLLLALGVGLFLNVYASFFPFLQSIGHVSDYNVAYYSAMSAVERGMLITKYRAPGFVGSGGLLAGTGRGPVSDQQIFFVTGSTQGNWWTVNSRTTTIPHSAEGNVDPFLITGNSTDYNALRYGISETFLFTLDNAADPATYYSGGFQNIVSVRPGTFSGELRLPPLVMAHFGNSSLCGNSFCDPSGSTDEVKVNWGMYGSYYTDFFTLMPTIGIFYYSGMQVNYPYDNAIRTSLFNSNNGATQLKPSGFTLVSNGYALSGHTIVSSQSALLQNENFPALLQDPSVSRFQLSLGLVTLLRSLQGSVYPYLEYRLSFPQAIADRFFTIDGHGRNRGYDVQIQIKKPTIQGTVGGDFTVIF